VTESWRTHFPAAAGLAVAGLAAWAAQLQGTPLGILPRDHGAFMLWGVLGTGIQGFLYTAYAKQNDAPLPSRTFVFVQLALQIFGAVGLLAGHGWLALPPWLFVLGWSIAVARPSLARRWDDTTAAVPAVLLSGLVGLLVHTIGGNGTVIGVTTFVAPLALAILDRVLPFFSSKVTPGYTGRRLPWFIAPMFVLSWLRVTPYATWATALLLALLVRQWWGWRPWPASRTPMIAVLHLGVAWFAVAWLLDLSGAPPSLGVHALVIGGLGSLLLGMSMRVVRGHGGLPLVLGRAGTVVIVLAQVAAITRITGGSLLVPAIAFASAFGLWLFRFSPTCIEVDNAR
jgi:uncharacterized protein involved in response to NO